MTGVLLVGYGLGLVGLAVQVVLAELANRWANPRRAACPALLLAGVGAGVAALIDPDISPNAVRGLAVVLLGVVWTGVLVLLRVLAREVDEWGGRR
jgi:hypothetical protein